MDNKTNNINYTIMPNKYLKALKKHIGSGTSVTKQRQDAAKLRGQKNVKRLIKKARNTGRSTGGY